MRKKDKKAAIITLIIAFILVAAFSIALLNQKREDTASRSAEEIDTNALLQSVLTTSPHRGPNQSPVTIVEFGDFQCPFCKNMYPVMAEILRTFPNDVQHVWVHTLNPEHSEAEGAAIAAQCALQQDYFWEYHNELFEQQDNLSPTIYNQIAESLGMNLKDFRECLVDPATKDTVRNHNALARQYNISSTPTFQINDQTFEGEMTVQEITSIINSQLR